MSPYLARRASERVHGTLGLDRSRADHRHLDVWIKETVRVKVEKGTEHRRWNRSKLEQNKEEEEKEEEEEEEEEIQGSKLKQRP